MRRFRRADVRREAATAMASVSSTNRPAMIHWMMRPAPRKRMAKPTSAGPMNAPRPKKKCSRFRAEVVLRGAASATTRLAPISTPPCPRPVISAKREHPRQAAGVGEGQDANGQDGHRGSPAPAWCPSGR